MIGRFVGAGSLGLGLLVFAFAFLAIVLLGFAWVADWKGFGDFFGWEVELAGWG